MEQIICWVREAEIRGGLRMIGRICRTFVILERVARKPFIEALIRGCGAMDQCPLLMLWTFRRPLRMSALAGNVLQNYFRGLRRFNAPSTSRNLSLIADNWEIQFRIEANVEQELATATDAFSIGTVASDFFNSIGT